MDTSVTSLRSILWQLDATATSVARLEFTRNVALRHEADLCAMFIESRGEEPAQRSFSKEPAELMQLMDRGDIDRATSLCDDTPSKGSRPVHWLSSGADPVKAFCRQAPYADLLVLAQHDLSAPSSGTVPANFVESIGMASGRRALVLPVSGNYGSPDRDVHGIESTLHRNHAAPTDAGEVLLSFASAIGADLLVMGCYGHHRTRELVLGGASRTVLMAH